MINDAGMSVIVSNTTDWSIAFKCPWISHYKLCAVEEAFSPFPTESSHDIKVID